MSYHNTGSGYSNQSRNNNANLASNQEIEDIFKASTIVSSLCNRIVYNKRFYYTDGFDFLFEGRNYIGYVNIDENNQAWKSKYDQIFKVLPLENTFNDNIFDGKYYDTTIFSDLVFDFTLDDILFKPNELINKNSINYKLDKLYDNFLKIYNFCNMSDPLLPDNFPAYVALSSNASFKSPKEEPVFNPGGADNNTFFKVISTSEQFLSAGSLDTNVYPPLSVFDVRFTHAENTSIEFLKSEKDNSLYTMFMTISSVIYAFKLDDDHTTFTQIASTLNVGGAANQITFDNITSLTTDGKDMLYVNDNSKNQIHKLYVGTIINEDRTGVRDFQHIDTIGSPGKYNTNLNSNEAIVYGDDSVYVYKPDSYSIRKFTKDFKFVTEYFNERFFKNNTFRNMSYNKYHNEIWVVTENFQVLILDGPSLTRLDQFEFNSNKFAYTIPLIPNFKETPRKIEFSSNNSNIYYLVTNKNVYKYYINKQSELINKFTIDFSFDDPYLWNTIFDRWGLSANFPLSAGDGITSDDARIGNQYPGGRIATADTFTGAGGRTPGFYFNQTGTTDSVDANVHVGTFKIHVNPSGTISAVDTFAYGANNKVGDVITVPDTTIGGSGNFTFRVASKADPVEYYTALEGTQLYWDQLPNYDRFFFVNNPIVSVNDDINNKETLLVLGNTRLFKFVEKNDNASLLSDKYPNFYKKSEIFLDKELFNNITFNLAVYKHITNLNILLQNLNKKATARFDQSEYLFFDDFSEISYDAKQKFTIKDPRQFFVGVNEVLTGNVLNRVISNLYNYQEGILKLTEVERIGLRIPPLSTVFI
jgi:hypothetical protein